IVSEDNSNFSSLFQRLSMKNIIPDDLKVYDNVPYNLYCPSLINCVKDRTCRSCLSMLKKHTKFLHRISKSKNKIRSKRVAAHMANELLAIISREEQEDVEWMDTAEVQDGEHRELYASTFCSKQNNSYSRILTVHEHLSSVWQNID